MEISLADAERVIAAARRRADELRVIVSIVVVDPRGDLKAAVRGDQGYRI
jgi:uncharacterized protein GlcG (DUF336 family)